MLRFEGEVFFGVSGNMETLNRLGFQGTRATSGISMGKFLAGSVETNPAWTR